MWDFWLLPVLPLQELVECDFPFASLCLERGSVLLTGNCTWPGLHSAFLRKLLLLSRLCGWANGTAGWASHLGNAGPRISVQCV